MNITLQPPLKMEQLKPAIDELSRLCKIKLNDLKVLIDPHRETPVYLFEGNVIILKSDPSHNYYQQKLYQFAHELIHHLLFSISNKEDRVFDRKEEEIFATSFALHMVKVMGWEDYYKTEIDSLEAGTSLYSKYKKEIKETIPRIPTESMDILEKVLNIEYGITIK